MAGHERFHPGLPLFEGPLRCSPPRPFPLLDLPAEILIQVLREAYIPDKIIITNNGRKAVLKYWRKQRPVSATVYTRSAAAFTTLEYCQFHPSVFAVNRFIYAETRHLFFTSPVTWHFANVTIAWKMLSHDLEHGNPYPIIPASTRRLIRHISMPYKGEDLQVLGLSPTIATPMYNQIKKVIHSFKANQELRILELTLPWPDWDHEVKVIRDGDLPRQQVSHYKSTSDSPSSALEFTIRRHPSGRAKEHPWAHSLNAARAISDLCWQGIETRIWLWAINLSHLDAHQIDVGVTKLETQVENWSAKFISRPQKDYYEGTTFRAVDEFFRNLDPADRVWKDRMLMSDYVQRLGGMVGIERVRFRVDLRILRSYGAAGSGTFVSSADRYAGLRPLVMVS